MKTKLILTTALLALFSPTWAAERITPMTTEIRPVPMKVMERADESVLLIEMHFSKGKWQAKPLSILPCGGPSKVESTAPMRSMLQLKSRDGKILFRRHIGNPRLVLIEDPKEEPRLLAETTFTLRIPLRSQGRSMVSEKEVYSFEFFEDSRDDKKPATRLNLSKVMPELSRLRTTNKRASCQLIKPRMDKLPELKAGPSTALSTDSLASMLKNDRELLVKWGIDNRMTPDELKKLVFEHKDQWARLSLNKRSVETLLQEYSMSYKNR